MKKKLSILLTKLLWSRSLSEIAALALACLIAILLLIAAVGKFFYPGEMWVALDRLTAVVEVVWIFFLIYFHLKWQVWFVNGLLFFCWAGYAFFWLLNDLPCGCMGKLIAPKNGVTFFMDLLVVVLSILFTHVLGARRKFIYLNVAIGLLCAVGGFFIAKGMFDYTVKEWKKT